MAVFKKALPENKREMAKCFSQMPLEVESDAAGCSMGVRNQVKGWKRIWAVGRVLSVCVGGVDRKFCRNLWVSLLLLHLRLEGHLCGC